MFLKFAIKRFPYYLYFIRYNANNYHFSWEKREIQGLLRDFNVSRKGKFLSKI